MEEIMRINDFPDYYISNLGNVISTKKGKIKKLKPWTTPNSDYYTVTLCNNGNYKKQDIHRLVAKYFVPNPNNYPVVNHLDHDKHNNSSDNLEWTTVQKNVHHSYSTMGPDRNKRKCKLIFPNNSEMIFESYADLVRYKQKNNLKFSETSLRYNLKSQGYKLEKL